MREHRTDAEHLGLGVPSLCISISPNLRAPAFVSDAHGIYMSSRSYE